MIILKKTTENNENSYYYDGSRSLSNNTNIAENGLESEFLEQNIKDEKITRLEKEINLLKEKLEVAERNAKKLKKKN